MHTPFSAIPPVEIKMGKNRLRREPHTILKQPSPSRQENTHSPSKSFRELSQRREEKRNQRSRQQPSRAAATPSSRRGRGRRAGGSHFSSPTITRTPVPRVATLQTRRSATLTTGPQRHGRSH